MQHVSLTIIDRNGRVWKGSHMRRFRASFGTSPFICASIWNKLDDASTLPMDARPKHLLWAMLFLKVYAAENVSAPMCGCDEKTWQKWVWSMLEAVSELEVVRSRHSTSKPSPVIAYSSLSTLELTHFLQDLMGKPLHREYRKRLPDICGWY